MDKFQTFQPPETIDNREFMNRLEAAFKVPLAWALASGLLSGIGLTLVGLVWRWKYTFQIAVTLGVLISMIVFVTMLLRFFIVSNPRKLIHRSEEEASPSRMIRIRLEGKNPETAGYKMEEFDLPGTPEQLKTLCTGLLAGREFTEATWAGKSKLYSIPNFRKLRQIWLAKGIIEYINPNPGGESQGMQPTPKGWEAVKEFADADDEEYVK